MMGKNMIDLDSDCVKKRALLMKWNNDEKPK